MKQAASFIALLTGIIGASLLSFDFEYRNWGYVPFIISGICTVFTLWKKDTSLVLLNLIFTLINANGIYQHLL